MELGLKGKVALVTGSSRGIGRGVALALAAEGCDVMLTGRDQQALEEVAGEIRAMGRRAAIAVLDLREPGAPEKLIEQVKREFGGLDILVNNAGATKRGDFLALTDADWDGRLCAEILRPCAAGARRLAAAQGAARLAHRHRRHRRAQADRGVHHRRFRQCRGRRLHKVPRRSRQGGRRASQLHSSEHGRDRPAVAAHQGRDGAHRLAGGQGAGGNVPRASASPASAKWRTSPISSPSWSPRAPPGCTARPSISTAGRYRHCERAASYGWILFPGAAQHEVVRCRPGIVTVSEPACAELATAPDQRHITPLRSVLLRIRGTWLI